jgi:hypothetical protein
MGAALLLSGCVNNTALDDLRDTTPTGSAFNKALFKNYSAIARSFGSVGASAGIAFDQGGSLELTEIDSHVGALANAYAEKAIIAARGTVVEPEPGVDVPTHKMRDRLIRALERGREGFPVDSARAQTDYDCWMMNATIPVLANSAKKCRASLEISMKRLESEAKAPAAAPAPAPSDNSEKPATTPVNP